MSKNTETPKGKRITGRKASAERYIPFYEFLLYDPNYREMKEKAKILYAFLRKKALYFEEKTEAYEEALANGEDPTGTKSYRDENDEIYCIADNAELAFILQCHYNRVPDFKKELKKFGLLDEVRQLNTANRLYVLEPEQSSLAESWIYIEEIKELRQKIKTENSAKAEKRKAQKVAENVQPQHNSQNASYNNSQNVSYHNSQNVSKTKSKGFKSIPKSLNSTLNLSISGDIQSSSLPLAIQKTLDKKIDRLIEFEINIFEVQTHFEVFKDFYSELEYNYVLDNLLKKMNVKPRNFGDVMNDWLARNRQHLNDIAEKKANGEKLKRTEKLPDWFEEIEQPKQEMPSEDLDARKKAIEAKLAQFRK